MNHWTARRLLPCILDHSLPAAREAEVRAHADGCRSCAARLEELEASESLLLRLPLSLVPLETDRAAELRLASLARWSAEVELPWQERLGLSAVSAFACAAMLALVISVGHWSPVVEDTHPAETYAFMMPYAGPTPLAWRD